MNDYKVDLQVYQGPLDLLLFLIRREEVDIYDIPIARILEQYLTYVELLKELDPDTVGEFLVVAATLMEIKSRTLLPTPPPVEGEEDELSDPRLELVRQLLQYKTFKDAARKLGAAAQIQALRHPRQPGDVPDQPPQIEITEVQVWDLLAAFKKLLEATGRRGESHEIVYDDTPLALHATDIIDILERVGGSQVFEALFHGRGKSQMIGLFLALLELIRQRRVRAEQAHPSAPIILHLIDPTPLDESSEPDRTFIGESREVSDDGEFVPDVGDDEEFSEDDDPLLADVDRTLRELEQPLRRRTMDDSTIEDAHESPRTA